MHLVRATTKLRTCIPSSAIYKGGINWIRSSNSNTHVFACCTSRRSMTASSSHEQREEQDNRDLPLSGITILDMSRVLAGPYATQLLSDMGARIIKIESPSTGGDDTRSWQPPVHEPSGLSAYFMSANRNKQSVCIDLKSKYGPEIIRQLAERSDVFIENFKVGGLSKFALDYESLHKINPKLIYCSISGYGQNGPRKNEPGYDFVMQAKSGLMSITGADQTQNQTTTSTPYKVGTAIVDVMTGMYASTAILSCIIQNLQARLQKKEEHGQYIDLSLYDVSLSLLANQSMNYLVSGNSPKRLGNRHPNIVPYEMFDTGDGQIVVAVGNDSQFQNFIKVLFSSNEHLQQEILSNEKFRTNKARVANRQELVELYLQPQLKLKDAQHWESQLLSIGVPCSRVNSVQEAFEESQVSSRNMLWDLKHEPSGTSARFVGQPIQIHSTKTSGQQSSSSQPYPLHKTAKFPPSLGEHTEQVLRDMLQASPEQMKIWREAGTFGQ